MFKKLNVKVLKKISKQQATSLIVIFLSVILIAIARQYNQTRNDPLITLRKNFERKELKAQAVIKLVSENSHIIFAKEKFFTELSENDGIEIFVFKNDSAKVWTSALIHPQKIQQAILGNQNFIDTESVKASIVYNSNNKEVVAIIKLSENFSIQNKYIKNKNFLVENSPYFIQFLPYSSHLEGVYFSSKEPAFSIIISEKKIDNYNYAVFLGLIFIFLMSWLFFLKNTIKFAKHTFLIWLIGLFTTILVWGLILLYKPPIIFENEIFSPSTFAVFSWLSSLGEFIVWSIILSFFAIIFPSSKVFILNTVQKTFYIIYGVLIYLFSALSVKWVIENSGLKFNFNEITSLDSYSILAVFTITWLFFSSCIFLKKISQLLSKKNYLLILFFIVNGGLLLIYEMPFYITILFSATPPILLIILFRNIEKNTKQIISALLVAITLFVAITHFDRNKERVSKQFFSQKIASDNDPMAELLFQEMEQNILNDKETNKFINDDFSINKSLLEQYLKEQYFTGYWDKYIFQVTPCFENDSIIVQPQNEAFACKAFFNYKIIQYGKPVNRNENLFLLIDDKTGTGNYLAVLEKQYFKNNEAYKYTLYIELFAKIIPEGSGYPELLIDNRYSKVSNVNPNYSYAKYKKNNLVLSSGNYKYSLQIPQWATNANNNEEVCVDGQNHLIFKPNNDLCIIISKPDYGILGKLTGVSYLFGILLLLFFIDNLNQQGIKQTLKAWKNFRTRIQVLVAGTIAVATIIFGITTFYYQQRQYNKQNDKIIREKLRSILAEVEDKFGQKETLTATDDDILTYYLIKLSNVFFTDLNIYDTKGELLASSRSNIFEIGLASTKINNFAYHQLTQLKNEQFIHREKIGMLSFFSAYSIIKNDEGKILGFLNVPYFARQDEMEKELSLFISALINVYVVLFLLSLFIAIIISRLIAEPLQLIRSRLGDIALGKPNMPIDWFSDDEIGLLIKEYNKMIYQLEESAEKLARSERESAWREMAKQVAHEIKNPLTPMKLSVQHLERTWKETPQEFEQRLKKFTQTLVEQIDTLSHIANEFSDFAKMPRPQSQPLNILNVAQQSIDFFKTTTPTHFILNNKAQKTIVLADKDQMIRVFNNLIKNAIQAIEHEDEGLIEIMISEKSSNLLIAISDNGNGISDELKEKIFQPNFTTKTSGMGLGLAMVKNIIRSHGGDIWFESELQKGTTFYFTLPIVENVA